ncbi:MAG: Crp/Fnr family transcriptional regulator [Armatimonadota bacterium]|nr:Crp/Fnr family transcriptional regulator [Armatimonadota bacterium]
MTAFADPEQLRQVPLFADLSAAQIAHINALLHRKTFPARATVMLEEQPGEIAYVIQKGSVKITVAGDEIDTILAILGAGEVVGEMSLVDSLGRSATVETQEESTLLWIERASFWECFETMLPLTRRLVGILSRRVRMANARIQSLAQLDVDGRIARQVLAFSQEYGQPVEGGGTRIPLRLTQTDLAGLIGASRESVNHVLVVWKQHKYVSVDKSYHLTVLNSAALARRCR